MMLKRVVVYEELTGCGRVDPDEPLLREAETMVTALVRDLVDAPSVETVAVLRDVRLDASALSEGARIVGVGAQDDVDAILADELDAASAFWPIAPEEGGRLERLCALAAGRCRLLNSAPDAVRVAGSKEATAERLSAAGLACIPTWRAPPADRRIDRYVVKPDKGAGGVGLRHADTPEVARALLRDGDDLVVQPYVRGRAMSLSVSCSQGRASVLSVNEQRMEAAHTRAYIVACREADERLAALAQGVLKALPGLAFYVGVDFIETDVGAHVVVEVNPRLTSSYAGIRKACGFNPAQYCIAASLHDADAPPPLVARAPVEVAV